MCVIAEMLKRLSRKEAVMKQNSVSFSQSTAALEAERKQISSRASKLEVSHHPQVHYQALTLGLRQEQESRLQADAKAQLNLVGSRLEYMREQRQALEEEMGLFSEKQKKNRND